MSDYQSYIAHHIALQEHNSITLHTPRVLQQLANMKSNLLLFLEPSRSNTNPSSPDLRNYHHHLCSPFPVSALLPPSLCYMYGPITRTQLRPRTANWTEIESSFYVRGSKCQDDYRIGTKTQMHVPSFLLVLAGSLVALPGPGRCNSPSHELTIMFAK